MPEHVHLFVAGLHRSGTSLLSRAMADHPEASSFSDTGFPEDEGQFLQRVYPVAKIYGGPGKFGFDSRSHLTERSPLVSEENKGRLRSQWGRHWDLSKRVLVEKSPPNLLKLRFLQAMFPEATFVVTMRHPIAVALATRKWSLTSIHSLIRHWLVCHEIFLRDARLVRRLIATRYETLVTAPDTVTSLQRAAGLSEASTGFELRTDVNATYFQEWRCEEDPLRRARNAVIARLYERRANRFGYSLLAPERAVPPAPELRRLLFDG
jgi:Sulfotransferase family